MVSLASYCPVGLGVVNVVLVDVAGEIGVPGRAQVRNSTVSTLLLLSVFCNDS